MLLDGLCQFTGTPGTVSSDSPTTGTVTSTNQLDMVNARDIGSGYDIRVLAQITATFTGGTSIQAIIQGAPDNGSGAPGTWTTMMSGPVVATASATIGVRLFDNDVPREAGAFPDRPGPSQPLPRFLRMQWVIVGTMTGGSVYAALVLDRTDQTSYPPGIIINN
jgi:hypothetical protein